MDYKLFDEFITLQALLKNIGILHSGGAIKGFLAENTVLFNGEDEKRRGKKIRIGDTITLPAQEMIITIIAPSDQEIAEHKEEMTEKERVAALVKKLNQANKATKKVRNTPKKQESAPKKQPVRFPGT